MLLRIYTSGYSYTMFERKSRGLLAFLYSYLVNMLYSPIDVNKSLNNLACDCYNPFVSFIVDKLYTNSLYILC